MYSGGFEESRHLDSLSVEKQQSLLTLLSNLELKLCEPKQIQQSNSVQSNIVSPNSLDIHTSSCQKMVGTIEIASRSPYNAKKLRKTKLSTLLEKLGAAIRKAQTQGGNLDTYNQQVMI